MTLAAMAAAPATAQCAPEPTQAGGITTCTGADTDGLRVTTYGTTVTVSAGANVRGANGPAIAVQLPSGSYGNTIALSVAGRVDGNGQAGIALLAPENGGYGSFSANLTIAAGGVVTGGNAIVLGQPSGGYGDITATIDNAGTITGTSGVALLSNTSSARFASINNRAGGTIGAIQAAFGTLTNAGTIDGVTLSAIDAGTNGFSSTGTITNSGTIAANTAAATIANVRLGFNALTNSGTIVNRGSGAAIAGETIALTNAAGGRIVATGPTAIRAGQFLTLTNTGTITGDVVVAGASGGFQSGSTVDSSAGRLDGALRFAAGADTLIATYANGALVTGISGAIDGGAGTDTLRVALSRDATIATPLTLPTNFEQLALAPAAGTTTTLATGFAAPAPLLIGGSGTIVNRTTLAGVGAVIAPGASGSFSLPSFVNAGAIVSAGGAATGYAVDAGGLARFENGGTITADRGGVSASFARAVVNAGTITAGGTALTLFSSSFTNAGTIRSTGGNGNGRLRGQKAVSCKAQRSIIPDYRTPYRRAT